MYGKGEMGMLVRFKKRQRISGREYDRKKDQGSKERNDSTLNIHSKTASYSKVKVIVLILLSLATFLAISFFSSQQGYQSASTSTRFSKMIVEEWNRIFHLALSEENRNLLIGWVYEPVRKLAHITEYAILAVILYFLVSQFTRKRRTVILMTFLIIFFCASVDEIHQLFIPLRGAKFSDVMIDSLGGLVGISLINLIYDICSDPVKVK
ncbi:MAG TPA: VanZ family protein [Lachnospiraceae bacterium]|nr:VanZ family protein [Lachnospiraceae bacterium]HEX3077105.1 VanZ family protein [Lachnospiraceae bacterium]